MKEKIKKIAELPEELYRQIHKNMPILCVDIILKSGDEVLLIKRTNKPAQGTWWFPGGRVFKGETLLEAAKRKMKQEVGLDIEISGMIGLDETIFPDGPFDGSTHTVIAIFLAEISNQSKNIKLDSQSNEYKWFKKAEKDFHPYMKKYMEAAKKIS